MQPLRLTVVLTHPVQYYSPWFRYIARHVPEITLTVVYAVEPDPVQQGVGFDRAFTWNVPLRDGYTSLVVRPARGGDRIDSTRFRGLDVPGIGRAIADTRPDVVVVPGWYSITLVRALWACRRRGIPVLYRGDTNLRSGPRGWRRGVWRLTTRARLAQFDGFLCPGRRARDYLRRFGAPDHRVFDVPHCVDNELFESAAAPFHDPAARAAARARMGLDAQTFAPVFVGRLCQAKRPLDAVRAMARLAGPRTLLVVGAGTLEGEMRAEAERLGVEIRMLGFVNQAELGQVHALADCLVLPSDREETWGLVVNEAMATGLPAVVSDLVGCGPDLVRDGETGFTYPTGNIEQLAAALEKVRDGARAERPWASRCRDTVRAFSFQSASAGLLLACRSVLAHSPGEEPDWTRTSPRVVACCGQMVMPGGLERMTFEVVRVVTHRGGAVHCLVNGWENHRITPLAEASGASWSITPDWHSLTRRLTPATVARMLREMVRASSRLLRQARRIDATHVLLPEYGTALRLAPALLWLRARGVMVVLRLGNAPERGAFYARLWRRAIGPLVDRCVCNSEFTRRELLAHGVPASKVTRVYNALPGRTADSPSADRLPGRIVYIGQIIPEKGVDLLLDAVALVRGGGLDASLDVVGDIDGWEAPRYRGYREGLRARASQPDLAGHVSFLGWREDVADLLARAAVHCCPSRPEQREAFGVVVLESKLAGLPSVVSSSGALSELVTHRVDGWVCEELNANTLAEGLAYFLSSPRRLEAAGRQARASAARFGYRQFADSWWAIFLGERPPAEEMAAAPRQPA